MNSPAATPASDVAPAAPAPASPARRRQDLLLVALIVLFGNLVALIGVEFGAEFVRQGEGYLPDHTGLIDGLYRFDGKYYYDIAAHGYSFDGDVHKDHNIVFLPTFPLLIRAVHLVTGLDYYLSGYLVTHLCFLCGCLVIFRVIEEYYGRTAAFFTVLGLNFSAASFAFHAYYAESVFLLLLALAFRFLQQRRYLAQALVLVLLGGTRVQGGVFCAVFALEHLWRAWQAARERGPLTPRTLAASRFVGYALLSFAGVWAYLIYVAVRFGNPLVILPAIKVNAYNLFHRPVPWYELITLKHLAAYCLACFRRPMFFLLDINTTNFLWALLGLIAALYALWRLRPWVFAGGFALYWPFTYSAIAGAEFLAGSYRYNLLMLPLYVLAADVYTELQRRYPGDLVKALFLALLAVDLLYMFIYLIAFANGIWFYF